MADFRMNIFLDQRFNISATLATWEIDESFMSSVIAVKELSKFCIVCRIVCTKAA
jgi:hypothetical protein